MNLFTKLPGFVQSPAGLEHRIWQRLPIAAFWGTVAPTGLALVIRAFSPLDSLAHEKELMLWDFMMFGVVLLHLMLVLVVGIVCFIVRVMKGPAYVADAYPLPDDFTES